MLTATQVIRQAALQTGTYEFKEGKAVTYVDADLQPTEDAHCWLCGGDTGGQGVSTKKAIKPTFTDNPYARCPESKTLCPGCAFSISYRELRNYSIVASPAGILHPTRVALKEILLRPPVPPFVICIAVSGQKHITFKASVNYDKTEFEVMLEEQRVMVKPREFLDCLRVVEIMYIYFTKDEIGTGHYSQNRIREMGLMAWESCEREVKPWRGTRIFELVLFVAQKGEKPEVKDDAAEENHTGASGKGTEPVQGSIEWA